MPSAAVAVLAVAVAVGAYIRAFFIPHTAGSDVVQFAAFADSAYRHGLCFYKYAGGDPDWPYNWPFPYGPLVLLLLALVRAHARGAVEAVDGNYYAPMDWAAALKTVYAALDVVNAALLYRLAGRSWRGAAAALFYYLSPAVVYTTSIYGMLDPLPLALLLAALGVRRDFPRGFLLGLAAATKANAAPAAVVALLASPSRWALVGFAAGALLLFVPFEAACPGSLAAFAGVLAYLSAPGYNPPVVYSFNGLTTLATYLHEEGGGDYLWLVRSWWLPAVVVYALILIKRAAPAEAAYLSYLAYVTTYWRVNYQYFLPLVGLAALYASSNAVRLSKALALTHTSAVSAWVFMYPTSWWARVHVKNPSEEVAQALDAVSLKILDPVAYVYYSLFLTALGYAALAASLRR